MNETKKMKSIARRINGRWVAGLLSAFLFFDLVIAGIALGGWCYFKETETGEPFNIKTVRKFSQVSPGDAPPGAEQKKYLQKADSSLLLLGSAAFDDKLKNVQYIYTASDGKERPIYAGRFLIFLCNCAIVILILQLLILLVDLATGTREFRKYLAPLDEMALTARKLTNATALDETKFHDLEDAISQISPTREDARLHTGNTELQSLEEAVNNLLDRMRQSYQQQARFVSDASHELRTPIAVIQGYANMLDRWGKDDETILDESITAIKSESDHMKKLVEQLLFLARGDSGRTKLVFEDFSLTAMMKEVYDESVMIDKEHSYLLSEAPETITINGDSSMLKQAARILVDNAAKYTPVGSEIKLQTAKNENGEPCFIVQDEGIGIGEGDVAHVFERFYRSDPARGREGGGTGLGLSIAKWIIDKHGGYFQVLSREELGTRITICLPPSEQAH